MRRSEGKFVNGPPINISLQPAPGGRELKVASTDGGSALRAANFYSKVAGGTLGILRLDGQCAGFTNSQWRIGCCAVLMCATKLPLPNLTTAEGRSAPVHVLMAFPSSGCGMPFTTDAKFVRLCDIELKGNDLGGVAEGIIRKSDGAIDITGTMIPAQSINGFLEDVPLLGQILTGGKGEGLFGITFAMGGTIQKPRTQVNPLSALAPGFLRKAFEYRGTCGRSKSPNAAGRLEQRQPELILSRQSAIRGASYPWRT